MNKKFMIGGCAAAAVAGNMVMAEDISYFNPYATLKGGYAFLGKRNDIKYKGGFAGAVELGVSYDAWRLGLELGYKSNKIKDFKLPGGEQGTHFILNGGYDEPAPVTGNLAGHACNNAAAGNTATAAVAGKSVYNAWATGGGVVVDGHAIANTHRALVLKNVSYFNPEKLTALTGMLNVCYDYAMTDAWSIYAGVGLGVARVNLTARQAISKEGSSKVIDDIVANAALSVEAAKAKVLAALPTFFDAKDITKTEYSKTVFAWQLMAGVGYEFNENWKLTLGYKLFNTAKVKQTFAGKEYKIKTPFNHTAELGLTYTF